ncbi:MAG: hypothetical protein HYR88_18290 [Verrucomicrobia bacterium]|nr:hypothetical protein [Verrucomicrobiota bacterium]MBI3871087.1 hypothetical protein [Verrucomicrobiota bacterium]
MRIHRLRDGGLVITALVLALTGCGTSNPDVGASKFRGVYTTVALEDHELDMPASGYAPCKDFGPHQRPAAVVVGYGIATGGAYYAQGFDLELVEIDSARTLLRRHGESLPGKAAMLELPIQKDGGYRLKLIIKGAVYDTWDFTVKTSGAKPL